MSDIRAVPVILDEKRKAALVDRLKSMSAFTGEELEGVSFVTARDIEEVFDGEFEADYDHRFVAETPASGYVDLICPSCKEAIPDVLVSLVAVLTPPCRSSAAVAAHGADRVSQELARVRVHVCGQRPLPKPVGPEVEGQTEAFSEDDAAAEADAIERLEGAAELDEELLPA